MKSYSYTYLDEGSKPECIDKDDITINHKVKQTSSAMITLCFTLPHFVGPLMNENEERWNNYILLLQILILSTSPYADMDSAATVKSVENISTEKVIIPPKKHNGHCSIIEPKSRKNNWLEMEVKNLQYY
ncbi:Hypothetical predicted protein [Mytilus galloprovincialis]|uniref:Uncharacterized protein n=1 Tax=Mytilus galloprovincialis TaxID=29158 RepID=A0A8B6GSY4_MYTGA|nr:Hypothetical predicted protein [Mytilus galloprovincialis]